MPLKVVNPSAAVTETIREHLFQTASLGRFRTRRLAAAAPSGLSLAAPHRMYNLGLADIKGANPVAKAKLTAWRYLVVENNSVIAAAEAVQKTPSAKPLFSNTNEGPFVDSMAKAIEDAEQVPEVQAGQFELSVLRVPALYLIALWLKSSGSKSKGDIFIPLDPAPPGMKAGERMSSADFTAALLQLKGERGKSTGTSS
jgi:hypothetical protein